MNKSKCCGAEVKQVDIGEGPEWYQCQDCMGCNEACDLAVDQQDWSKEFDEKYGKDFEIESKPYNYIHRGVDSSFQISDIKQFISKLVEEVREENKTKETANEILDKAYYGEKYQEEDIWPEVPVYSVTDKNGVEFKEESEIRADEKSKTLNKIKKHIDEEINK